MKKILVVVDMQNDFITGPLGTPEAVSIVDKVCEKIRSEEWDAVCATQDTHFENYLKIQEGKNTMLTNGINILSSELYTNGVAMLIYPDRELGGFRVYFAKDDIVSEPGCYIDNHELNNTNIDRYINERLIRYLRFFVNSKYDSSRK